MQCRNRAILRIHEKLPSGRTIYTDICEQHTESMLLKVQKYKVETLDTRTHCMYTEPRNESN